jgi:DinB family protein
MTQGKMNNRSEALAARLEAGAAALAAFAATLSETEWQTRLPKDGRKIGTVVHHVASVYPVEIHLASLLAAGHPITGVTWDVVATMNRDHAKDNDGIAREAALALLATNSTAAAAAIRAFSDEDLDRAAPVSLNSDAPLTCQFMIEDHAVRHSYHHLAGIRKALGR